MPLPEKVPALDVRPFLRVEAATAPAAVMAAAPTVKALLPEHTDSFALLSIFCRIHCRLGNCHLGTNCVAISEARQATTIEN